MTVSALVALFVLAVLLHNAEEALWLPRWSARAGRWYRPVGAAPFRFAAAALSALVIAVAVAGLVWGPHSLPAYLMFGLVFAMSANALFPHLAATLVMRRYMPGTATGVLLNLPLGCLLLQRAVAQDWVSPNTLAWSAPTVAVGLVLAIPVLFTLGRHLFPEADRSGAQRAGASQTLARGEH